MQFTKVRMTGRTAIDLPIIGALPTDSFGVISIDGLGPTAVDAFISKTSNGGGVYQGRRPQNRQLVVFLSLNPNRSAGETVEGLRTRLYGLFVYGADPVVSFQLMNGTSVVAQTSGYVTKMEMNPFSKDPELQITIDCLGPYLETATSVAFTPSQTPSLVVNNVGDVDAGFYVELTFNQAASSFRIAQSLVAKTFAVNYSFASGDVVYFDTRPGQKTVSLKRGSAALVSLLPNIVTGSEWLTLIPGQNTLSLTVSGSNWSYVEFRPKYWGI